MIHALKSAVLGLLAALALFSGAAAHAGYAEANPLRYIDPEGLSPKGFPRKPAELLPLEGGGGPGVGGSFGGRGPKTRPGQQADSQCPPEVQTTLDRIRGGQPYPHRNDGTTFKNKEGLLPSRPDGYYREWVHPTSGVQGPGVQRVVTGQGGEAYYSPDHYRTFIPLP